jgi:endonuclease-3
MARQLDYHTVRKIFTRFQAAEPEPKGELDHVNAFTLLVAVALSAQATDVGVNRATRALFQIADTPEKMLALGEEALISHIKTIGLYRNKARNVMKHPAQAVDTHIFRIGNRTGICPGKNVEAVERAIEDHIPVDFQRHAHHWLILHGRYTCRARKPACGTCLIRDLCPYEEKTL